jgi:hypothetical protein
MLREAIQDKSYKVLLYTSDLNAHRGNKMSLKYGGSPETKLRGKVSVAGLVYWVLENA